MCVDEGREVHTRTQKPPVIAAAASLRLNFISSVTQRCPPLIKRFCFALNRLDLFRHMRCELWHCVGAVKGSAEPLG